MNELYGKSKSTILPCNARISELVEQFSNFFVNKISRIREKLDLECTSKPSFNECPTSKLSFFQNVSPSEVRDIIISSPSKSCCLDPLPTSILKDNIDSLIMPITDIINESLRTGIVPSSFKHAVVTPLLKKSTLDPTVLSNFRPVSGLPFISKILEKVVFRQINTYLESNMLLEPHQSAYRKKKTQY